MKTYELICLINQASFLLGGQIEGLERTFLEEGGFTERLYNARLKSRTNRTSQIGQNSQT